MRLNWLLPIALLALASGSVHAQKKNISPPAAAGRELYLSRMQAAEALIQLGQTAEAREVLNAVKPDERQLEWKILNAMADRSARTIAHHTASVAAVAFSHDGQWVATGSADSTIVLWRYPSFEKVHVLRGHQGQVSTLAFSPDGSTLASGSTDKTVKCWNVTTGALTKTFTSPFTRGIYQVRFSPDGKKLAVCTWELLKDKSPPVLGYTVVIDATSGEVISRFDQDAHPSASLDFSGDGKFLAVATWGFVLYWYDLAAGNMVWQYDLSKSEEYTAMNSVDISPDNKSLVLATKDNRVRVINAADGTLRYQIDPWKGHSKWVNSVQFSPDGKHFASGSDDMYVLVWNTETGMQENFFRGHTAQVNSVAWSADGKTVISAARDGEVKMWSLDKPGEATIDVCMNGPWYAPVSKNKWLMTAACSDKQVTVWDLRALAQSASFSGFAANCAAFSDDERHVATGGHDALVRWLDVTSQQVVATMEGHTNSIYGIAYCPQQKLIASASADQTLRIWSVTEVKELTAIKFDDSYPYAVEFSADGKYLVAGLANGEVRRYTVGDWKVVSTYKAGTNVNILKIHPDQQRVVTGGGGGQVFISDAKGTGHKQLKGHKSAVYAADFHPGGKYLVTGSYDRTVRLWDVDSGLCTLVLHGFKDEVFTVSFFDNGNKLLVTETEGISHVIDLF